MPPRPVSQFISHRLKTPALTVRGIKSPAQLRPRLCLKFVEFPVRFALGSLELSAHFVFETLAYTLGFQLYRWQQKKHKQNFQPEQGLKLVLGCVLGAIVGAKLLGWLQTPYLVNAAGLKEWIAPGKTIVGGLLGGWSGIEFVKAKWGIQSRTGDAFVWPMTVGLCLGRMGCFLTGLADYTYGIATRLPWGVDFGDGLLRHPTQIYEMLWVVLLGLIVTRLKNKAPGSQFRLWMAAYLGFRFVTDWLKPVYFIYGGLSAIQWACLFGLSWALYSYHQINRQLEAQETLTSSYKKQTS